MSRLKNHEEDYKTIAPESRYKANNKSVKNSEANPQENNANELPYSDQIYVDYDDDSKVITKNYRKVSDFFHNCNYIFFKKE